MTIEDAHEVYLRDIAHQWDRIRGAGLSPKRFFGYSGADMRVFELLEGIDRDICTDSPTQLRYNDCGRIGKL